MQTVRILLLSSNVLFYTYCVFFFAVAYFVLFGTSILFFALFNVVIIYRKVILVLHTNLCQITCEDITLFIIICSILSSDILY